MAILSLIKFNGLLNDKEWIVYRYPGDSVVSGSQLVVGEGQVAVFVKGGRALDYFTAGTYTLTTENLPLLKGVINKPFGRKSPYTAEIYFINKTSKLDMSWGTIDPIQLVDPKYNIKLRVRAFGQFGVKVDDFRVFLTEIIGSLNPLEIVSYEKMLSYFKGILVMKVKSLIAQAIINNKISALEISASIDKISGFCKEEISDEFNRFGLKVVNFFIQSINFPDEDFEEINKILRDKASFDIIGDQRYVTKRSFDTLEAAAQNENNVAGTMMGAGVGLGAGLGVGGMMGNVVSNLNTTPVKSTNKCPGCGNENDENATFCGECGFKLAAKLICSNCGSDNQPSKKFCSNCGTPINVKIFCSNCNAENSEESKFCNDCGTKLEGNR